MIIGLTGGIGSGKTTAAHFFAKRGITIIDADVIAKELTCQGSPSLLAIVKYFGSSILQEDGMLNRAKLRDWIFQDAQKKAWLEQYLHPPIRAIIHQRCQHITSSYGLVIIPLLIEAECEKDFDRICVIDVDEKTQMQRVMQRDHVACSQIASIIKSQCSRQRRLLNVHDVINNQGSQETLEQQVAALHHYYLTLISQRACHD